MTQKLKIKVKFKILLIKLYFFPKTLLHKRRFRCMMFL